MGISVTRHPTAEWLARQLTEAFLWDTAPTILIRENDKAFGNAFQRRVRAMGIRDHPIAPRSPWQKERVINSIRRECLDQVPDDIESILKRACPIVASFGKRDKGLRGAAARLEGALERLHIDHDVKEYPDSGHSFLDDHKGILFGVLGLLAGMGYNEKDATDARKRIAAFFEQHLA